MQYNTQYKNWLQHSFLDTNFIGLKIKESFKNTQFQDGLTTPQFPGLQYMIYPTIMKILVHHVIAAKDKPQ